MTTDPDLTTNLSDRIDALAAKARISRSQIIRDALEKGHSLSWQEEWHRRMLEGITAADAGDFAGDEEVDALFRAYL